MNSSSHVMYSCIVGLVIACLNFKLAILAVVLYAVLWGVHSACFHDIDADAPRSNARTSCTRKSARASSSQKEKESVPNPRYAQAQTPDPAPSDSEIQPDTERVLSFPRIHELTPMRFKRESTSPMSEQRTVEEEYFNRGVEPNMKEHYTTGMKTLQRVLADELTSRDPAIKPIGGKFGCKPSIGIL